MEILVNQELTEQLVTLAFREFAAYLEKQEIVEKMAIMENLVVQDCRANQGDLASLEFLETAVLREYLFLEKRENVALMENQE